MACVRCRRGGAAGGILFVVCVQLGVCQAVCPSTTTHGRHVPRVGAPK